MSSGLRESRRFARRQRRRRLLGYALVLVLLGGLGLASYVTGGRLAESDLRAARRDIARLASEKAALEREAAAQRKAAEAARAALAALQQRYDEDVPKGERRALLALVDEQLGKGAKPDRLRFLISAASHEEECDGEPVTKRFIVRTPLYEGAASVVTFANGALTVSASGEPSQNAEGQVQAWFDPAKPIALELARLGEKPGRVTGTLPLRHALVVNGYEYRFNVVAGDLRGFVNVTADRCRFP